MYNWFLSQSLVIKTILASLFTFILTSMGAGIVFLFKKINKTLMDGMLALSGGIMLAATFWSLLAPSISLSKNLYLNSALIVIFGILSGSLLLYLSDSIYSKYSDKNKNVFMIIFSITIHNIPEGLAVGVAFGSLKYGIPGATLLSAISLAIGIGIQNFPEGAAISLPLRAKVTQDLNLLYMEVYLV